MPNTKAWTWGIALLSFFGFAQFSHAQRPGWKKICTEYKKGAVLIDVRTLREVKASAVKGAIHIPLSKIRANYKIVEKTLKAKKLNNKTIIFFCYSGGRAGFATMILRKAKRKNVYNGGGFRTWQQIASRKKVVCKNNP